MEKLCAECGNPFTSRRADTRTCGKTCWRALYAREKPSKGRQSKARSKGTVARRRRSDAELLETQRRAVQMSFAGMDIAQIQAQLGYDTWAGAQAALQAGMAVYRKFVSETDGADMHAFEVARCDWEIRQIVPAIMNPGPKVSATGKTIRDDDGNVVPDWDLKIKAMLAYDKIADRMTRLKGLYPEKQAPVSFVPVTHIVQGVAVEVLR